MGAAAPVADSARVHIAGLDAIRFVAATIVMLRHFPADYKADLAFPGPLPAQVIGGFFGVAFNGPAAVISFFVLSGLVIHLPYANGKPFVAGEYFARRYIRILPPVAGFMLLFWGFRGAPTSWNDTVLWSIIGEAVCYALYPLVRGFSFGALTPFAVVAAGWIALETRYFTGRPRTWPDRAGLASYSMYLVHPFALLLPEAAGLSGLPIYIAGTAIGVLLFYVAVERPSHRLARAAGRALSGERRIAT